MNAVMSVLYQAKISISKEIVLMPFNVGMWYKTIYTIKTLFKNLDVCSKISLGACVNDNLFMKINFFLYFMLDFSPIIC